ncbi:hypothetical protein UFOVP452_4 [uncultured Caudovirales phage]|uniref:Uncharacterized protein n=1 Tax=uncultured Caudovirales phage TaxID=2100421 RepID=A0A6J5M6J1_9CAUD|nr:hypothetical protein UFOVP452_4 [uncultured Caudovirales phage]
MRYNLTDRIIPQVFDQKAWKAISPLHRVNCRIFAEKVIEATLAAIKEDGFVIVPHHSNMTDEQAEAIANTVHVCGGIAYDAYRLAIDAAPAWPVTAEVAND